MKIQRTIYWNKLTEIQELKEFFEEDFQGFKKLIEDRIEEFEKFSDDALDKFSKLRALEVTNGCTQWGFRRGDKECLSVEQTRECMNLVMGFMKRTELYFPSEGQIEFDDEQKAFIQAGRSLYKDAFKNNVKESEREYYAASTAQFIVYGHERMERAMALVKQDYETLFSPYYIERGQKYIVPYLKGFE
ncbi:MULTISPECIES: hypothetical protein [unclassified Nostoc]|uniref:hypothetical protein n=1 Tax=unclassified Nostoc TaxID=2593658 RepID=UPI0025AB11F3|nr:MULTISPECIES: hypothetical protein [unclassified Nostoc]MDM9584101.1 hypothetical protein [Nostoc sp. GT001]MDZ7944503.1 hypothetical protein [Nostoc sp. EfeVER01]MDZ7991739.1 hypothetical protein [Nostoc sp. EspVER01]